MAVIRTYFHFSLSWVVVLHLMILSSIQAARCQNEKTPLSTLEKNYESKPNVANLEMVVNRYLLDSKYEEAEQKVKMFLKSRLSENRNPRILLMLARIYKYQYKKDAGMAYFLRAYNFINKHGTVSDKLEYGTEIIEFYRKFNEFDQALAEIEKYEKFIAENEIRDNFLLGRFYNRAAAVFNENSENNKAIAMSHKSLYYSRLANDLYSVATSYNELGFAHKHTAFNDSTLYYYRLSEQLFSEMNCYREAIHVKQNKVEFIAHFHYFKTHHELLDEYYVILDIVQSQNLDYPLSSLYDKIEMLYFFLGNFEKAYEFSRKTREASAYEAGIEREKSFQRIREEFENDRLKIENKAIQSKALYEEEKKNQAQTQLKIIAVMFSVITILSVVLYFLWLRVKSQNRELVIRNKQKTVLVQEIHHRVKNNLQFVRSILKMQQRLKSVNAKEAIEDVSRRIDAMSLVHEMLYLDEASMTVSAKEYFEKLLDLSESMYNHEKRLHLRAEIQDFHFDLEKLIALGVICSELLANSVKHVFHKIEKPEFNIILSKELDYYCLKVFDNGQENENCSNDERVKLGMRLIDIFSRQLNGTYSISQNNGYLFEMKFR